MTSVPAQWAATGYGLPGVCARHGEPATQRVNTRFVSRAPAWAIPFILLGALPYLIVVMAVRKTVNAQNWPYCAQCQAQRQRNLIIGVGGLVLSIVILCTGTSLTDNDSTSALAGLMILVGAVLFFVALIFTARSSRQFIAGAVVTRDGLYVELKNADPRFSAQIQAAATQSGMPNTGYQVPPGYAQPGYPQQAYPPPGYPAPQQYQPPQGYPTPGPSYPPPQPQYPTQPQYPAQPQQPYQGYPPQQPGGYQPPR
jgi:hypothetical protein